MNNIKKLFVSLCLTSSFISSTTYSATLDQINKNLEDISQSQSAIIMNQRLNDLNPFSRLTYFSNDFNYTKSYSALATDVPKFSDLPPVSKSKVMSNLLDALPSFPAANYVNTVIEKGTSKNNISDFLKSNYASSDAKMLTAMTLEKIGQYQQQNQQLLTLVKQQSNPEWVKELRSSSHDQLLRDISLQLTISNVLNYNRLQADYLNGMLIIANSMNLSELSSRLDDLYSDQSNIGSQLSYLIELIKK